MVSLWGANVSTDGAMEALKADIVQRMLYKQAETLMMFSDAVTMTPIDSLEFQVTLPDMQFMEVEEITEGALADFQKIEWYKVQTSMKKYQTRIRITDEAKVRNQIEIEMQQSNAMSSKGLARAKDIEIAGTLESGKGGTTAATKAWTSGDASIADDIATVIGKIFDTTYITDQDIGGLLLYYPAKLWPYLMKPTEMANIQNSIGNWITTNYRLTLKPTRLYSNKAMLVMQSNETALHLTYSGNQIPLSEPVRVPGVGNDYYVTQMYKTFILPNSKDDKSHNNRVQMITGVA